MSGSWSGSPGQGGERAYRTGRSAGYRADDGYGRGPQEYAPEWEAERRPAYAEDPWSDERQYGDEDRGPAETSRVHQERGGYEDRVGYEAGYGEGGRDGYEERGHAAGYGDGGYGGGYAARDGYGAGGYGDGGRDGYGDGGYGGRDPYANRGGYGEAQRREAARRRMRAEAAARARAEEEAVAATAAVYAPQRIVRRGVRRRQFALVAVLGSAVALLGERLASAFGSSGPTTSGAMTAGSTMAGTGGDGMVGASPVTGTGMGTAGTAGQATNGRTVLASTTDVPVGSAKIFAAHKLVVTQPAAGTFKAYSTVCTHAGCLLDKVKADKIYCPCHPGVFNLDGTVSSGPPPSSLAEKQITVSGNQILL